MARHILLSLSTFALAAIATPWSSKAAEVATDTLSVTQIAQGEYQYNLTLNDTGTTTLGTFWFGWTPGDNFMPASPTNITSPQGWQEMVTTGGASSGSAIQWTATSASDDLNAGNSLSGFSFDSTLTLAQLEAPSTGHPADPVFTAFVYENAPLVGPGVQLTPDIAPEPLGVGLITVGLTCLLVAVRRTRVLSK